MAFYSEPPAADETDFLTGGGEMGALMRAHDWSDSPLGEPADWPQSLRAVVALMINSRYPMFLAWGPKLAFLYNDGYAPIFGAKHPHMLGRPFREAWPEIWDDISPLVDRALAGEATYHENLHLVMERNGYPEDTWYSFSYSPVRDESGAVAGMFCACTETTGQVRNDAALRESEQRFRNMAEHAPVIMWVTDATGHCTYLNRRWYDFTGQSEAEAEGFGWLDATHPDDKAEAERIFLDANARQAPFRLEYRLCRASGDYAWAIDAASPRFGADGAFLGYVGSVVDIDERKRAEEAARESASELQTVLDAVPAAIWIARDADSSKIVGNQMSHDLLRVPSGRNQSLSAGEEERPSGFKIFHAGRELGVDELPVQRAARGELIEHFEEELRHDDGTTVHLFGNASPLYDADGEVRGSVAAFVDITDRKRSAEKLRDSEARLAFLDRLGADTTPLADADAVLAATTRLLGEHLGVSLCAYADMDEDQDGFTIRGDWAAPGSTSIVGHYSLADFGKLAVKNLSAGQPLVVNDNLRELAPEEAATFQNIGIAATICMPLVKDGRLTALMAIHDRVPRVWTDAELSMLREVTSRSWAHVERFAALADLRESEEQQRLVLDSAPGGFYSVDREGTTNLVSRGFVEMMGFGSDKEVLGRKLHALIHHTHPDGTPYPVEECPIYRCASSGEVAHVPDENFYRLDGSPVPVEYWVSPIMRGGEHLGAICTILDLTQRKAAEAALRESEEKYRSLFNSIDAGFCIVEMKFDENERPVDYKIVEANPAFERQTGLEGALGKWVSEAAPDLERHWHEAYGRVALTGEAARFENQAAPFDARWYDVHAYRVGEPGEHRVAVLFNDISDRRRAEEDLRRFNETLEARVEQRTAELNQAQDALRQSQKLEAMGQLTGGVAHDFNNLLTPIVGSLDLLQRKGLGDAREQRLIDGALQSAERARILVQRLLAFARRQPLQPSAVDVADLVAGMAELVASTSGPNIRLEVDVADDLPPALADPNQLEMAILNLAVNARDAMRDGGTLTIAAAAEEVAERHRSNLAPGRYVHLSVADNGCGMDEATLARAIEPFFSTKGIGKGTGLGLSMVHGLASQLGGALAVSSKPGLGTKIDLWLPIAAAAAGQIASSPDPLTGERQKGIVLLVDDEELVRMSTADMLADLGYRVVEADFAEAALDALGGGLAIDLLVTDHLMPGMTGADLARTLLERRPSTAVLIVSGYADAEEIAPDLPRLAKPFRQADLAAAIAALAA